MGTFLRRVHMKQQSDQERKSGWRIIYNELKYYLVNQSTPSKLTKVAHFHPLYIKRHIMLLQKNPYPPSEVMV